MKNIEIDDELYQYIASNTRSIGEDASAILRRLLNLPALSTQSIETEDTSTHSPVEKTTQSLKKQTSLFQTGMESEQTTVPSTPRRKKHSEEIIAPSIKRVKMVIENPEFQNETKTVNRFLQILTALYRSNPESFAQAVESVVGRSRTYFARDEASLLATGTHTKPKQIPETPYWVITNNNSARKMLMLEGTMQSMELPEQLIEEIKPYFLN